MIIICGNCGKKNRSPAKRLTELGRCGACKAEISPLAGPIEADPETFREITQEVGLPVLVDFWADWCGPCKTAAPEVAKTAAAMKGRAVVLKVDTERWPQLAAQFQVQGIPNFAILKSGKVVFQQAGVVPSATMTKWLEEAGRA